MTTKAFTLISPQNPVFITYLFWSAILVLKLFAMVILTGNQRWRKMTFISPEDLFSKKCKVKYDDDDIERVRRAHRNDLENILPFLTIGFFYCLTDPEPWLAINLFRLVGISRIIHTFVYAVIVIPQPARFLSFILALLPTLYMTLQVIKFCF